MDSSLCAVLFDVEGSSSYSVLCHPLTSEALTTLANETIELVDACARILAGTRQTVVPVQVTVLSHPSGLTVTAVTGNTGVVINPKDAKL